MSREVMQMALTVLERTYKMDSNDPQFQAVKALCTALAQPEHGCAECDKKQSEGWALYCVDCLREFYKLDPTNQRREWVGLTDEDKKEIYEQADAESWHDQPLLEAVEAKLKEKNT